MNNFKKKDRARKNSKSQVEKRGCLLKNLIKNDLEM
jgi:hypothetical protein